MLLHKDTKANLLYTAFVCGTGVISIGIYLMIRGDVAAGAAIMVSGVSSSTLSVIGLRRG